MIFLDLSGQFYASIFSLENAKVEINEENLLRSLLQRIYNYKAQFQNEYGRMIICCDSPKNWRKDVFPYYKQKRKEKRNEDEKDWNSIFNMFSMAKANMAKNLQEIVLEIEGLEADDLIALGTRLINKRPHLILSIDKDMNQLLKNPGVHFYHLMHRDYVNYDPRYLLEQVLTGDKSDGIPSILCKDDHFINPPEKRVVLSSKYKDKVEILNEEEIKHAFSDKDNLEEILQNYKRNRQLIDLDYIPSQYTEIFKQEFLKANSQAMNNDSNAYMKTIGINME